MLGASASLQPSEATIGETDYENVIKQTSKNLTGLVLPLHLHLTLDYPDHTVVILASTWKLEHYFKLFYFKLSVVKKYA